MSPEERHRRALATGLAPYLDSAAVAEAVALWQREYADRPSFSLQGYVSELCKRFELTGRRHDVHLNLVQAMSLPERRLAADPLASPNRGAAGHPGSAAFKALMNELWAQLNAADASQLRLDQLADLRRAGLPDDQRQALEYWLNQPRSEPPALGPKTLAPLVNRGYVLLCERFGPVRADRLLKVAVDRVRLDRPELGGALATLL